MKDNVMMPNMNKMGGGNTGPWDKKGCIEDIQMRTDDQVPRDKVKVIIEEFKEDELNSSDIESDNKKTEDVHKKVPDPVCQSIIQFTDRMRMLEIGEEVNDMDTTTDSFESLRCKEVLPDREDNIPEASINSSGSKSYKLHYNILQSTKKLIYKDIIKKPDSVWTPLGVMSIRRPDTKSRIKRVKTW